MTEPETTQNRESDDNKHGYGAGLGAEKPVEEMVLYEIVEPHIAKVTLNRPERHNALFEPDMIDELARKMTIAQDDDSVKVIIVTGNGQSFCAGADLRRPPVEAFGLKKGERLPQSFRMRGITQAQQRMEKSFLFNSKTVIAACHGATLAGGFQMAMQADLIVSSDDAFFGEPESRLGFAGFDTLLPVILLRLGINRGYEAIITGRSISAQELRDWGVISSVVPREQLMDEAMRYARAVAAHATDGLMLGRHAMQMFWQIMGYPEWSSFMRVAHPLYTNLKWRDDEFNFLRERNKHSVRDAIKARNAIWEDLGFA